MTAEDDNDKPENPQPKRKKTTRAKKIKKQEPEKDTYRDQITEAITKNLIEYGKKRKLSQKQITTINSYVEEYLSCFILLGYTPAGDPVTLVNAPTTKDSDSLGTLIQKFMMKYMDPPPAPPPHY